MALAAEGTEREHPGQETIVTDGVDGNTIGKSPGRVTARLRVVDVVAVKSGER